MPSTGFADRKREIAAGILLASLLTPAFARADCSKLIDSRLEYYDGIKYHLANRTTFDPGIKKLPYDVKIIDVAAGMGILPETSIISQLAKASCQALVELAATRQQPILPRREPHVPSGHRDDPIFVYKNVNWPAH